MLSKDIINEFTYATFRSGGKGGQNVNKVETAVEARWNLDNTNSLDEREINLIRKRLPAQLTAAGELFATSQQARTQLENKKIATENLFLRIKKALFVAKPRIATKPTKASKERRLETKKLQSERKANRRKW